MNISAVTVLGLVLVTQGVRDRYEPPDVPYTAIVQDWGARFVFPIPHRDVWNFGGPASREEVEFEWSITLDNDGHRYAFGVYVIKGPQRIASTDNRPAPLIGGELRFFEIDPAGRPTPVPLTAGSLFIENGDEHTANGTKLVVIVNGSELLQKLFYARPAVATFRERSPDVAPVLHEVPVEYSNYTFERPLPPRMPTWVREYSGLSGSPAIAPGGKCIAVSAGDVAEVLDRDGHTLWTWNHRKTNRHIGGSLAVNAACDTLAFSGYNGYPYMWIAKQSGSRKFVRVSAAPRSITFDHSGRFIALGSGLRFVYLFTSTGEERWKVDFGSYYVGAVGFSEDDRHIIVTEEYGVGMLSIDGKVEWQVLEKNVAHYSPNLQTFLTFFETMHGEYVPRVATYDAIGRELWSDSGEPCTVNSTGEKVVANLYGLKILSRSGQPIMSLPATVGCPIAFYANDQHFITRKRLAIEEVDANNQRFWAVPIPEYGADTVTPVWDAGQVQGMFLTRPGRTNTELDRLEWYAFN